MPSLLCLLTDTVKTHPPCLGQSRVPKAHISCLFTSVTAMFKLLSVSSLSCSVRDTSTLSSRCLGPNVCPPDQTPCQSRLPLAVPYVLLFRTCSIYLPWKKLEQRYIRRKWSLPQQPWRETEDRQPPPPPSPGPQNATASGPCALRCPPSCSEMPTFFSN